jgi:hypothetical protein
MNLIPFPDTHFKTGPEAPDLSSVSAFAAVRPQKAGLL